MDAPGFLQHFHDLAEFNSDKRVRAAVDIVRKIEKTEQFEKELAGENGANKRNRRGGNRGPNPAASEEAEEKKASTAAETVEYTLKRLVRGCASSRDCARQGFASALANLVGQGKAQVAELVDKHLEPFLYEEQPGIPSKRDACLGALFAIAALVESDAFFAGAAPEAAAGDAKRRKLEGGAAAAAPAAFAAAQKTATWLGALHAERPYLREPVCRLVEALARQVAGVARAEEADQAAKPAKQGEEAEKKEETAAIAEANREHANEVLLRFLHAAKGFHKGDDAKEKDDAMKAGAGMLNKKQINLEITRFADSKPSAKALSADLFTSAHAVGASCAVLSLLGERQTLSEQVFGSGKPFNAVVFQLKALLRPGHHQENSPQWVVGSVVQALFHCDFSKEKLEPLVELLFQGIDSALITAAVQEMTAEAKAGEGSKKQNKKQKKQNSNNQKLPGSSDKAVRTGLAIVDVVFSKLLAVQSSADFAVWTKVALKSHLFQNIFCVQLSQNKSKHHKTAHSLLPKFRSVLFQSGAGARKAGSASANKLLFDAWDSLNTAPSFTRVPAKVQREIGGWVVARLVCPGSAEKKKAFFESVEKSFFTRRSSSNAWDSQLLENLLVLSNHHSALPLELVACLLTRLFLLGWGQAESVRSRISAEKIVKRALKRLSPEQTGQELDAESTRALIFAGAAEAAEEKAEAPQPGSAASPQQKLGEQYRVQFFHFLSQLLKRKSLDEQRADGEQGEKKAKRKNDITSSVFLQFALELFEVCGEKADAGDEKAKAKEEIFALARFSTEQLNVALQGAATSASPALKNADSSIAALVSALAISARAEQLAPSGKKTGPERNAQAKESDVTEQSGIEAEQPAEGADAAQKLSGFENALLLLVDNVSVEQPQKSKKKKQKLAEGAEAPAAVSVNYAGVLEALPQMFADFDGYLKQAVEICWKRVLIFLNTPGTDAALESGSGVENANALVLGLVGSIVTTSSVGAEADADEDDDWESEDGADSNSGDSEDEAEDSEEKQDEDTAASASGEKAPASGEGEADAAGAIMATDSEFMSNFVQNAFEDIDIDNDATLLDVLMNDSDDDEDEEAKKLLDKTSLSYLNALKEKKKLAENKNVSDKQLSGQAGPLATGFWTSKIRYLDLIEVYIEKCVLRQKVAEQAKGAGAAAAKSGSKKRAREADAAEESEEEDNALSTANFVQELILQLFEAILATQKLVGSAQSAEGKEKSSKEKKLQVVGELSRKIGKLLTSKSKALAKLLAGSAESQTTANLVAKELFSVCSKQKRKSPEAFDIAAVLIINLCDAPALGGLVSQTVARWSRRDEAKWCCTFLKAVEARKPAAFEGVEWEKLIEASSKPFLQKEMLTFLVKSVIQRHRDLALAGPERLCALLALCGRLGGKMRARKAEEEKKQGGEKEGELEIAMTEEAKKKGNKPASKQDLLFEQDVLKDALQLLEFLLKKKHSPDAGAGVRGGFETISKKLQKTIEGEKFFCLKEANKEASKKSDGKQAQKQKRKSVQMLHQLGKMVGRIVA